jgi:rod shape determining protein RodA
MTENLDEINVGSKMAFGQLALVLLLGSFSFMAIYSAQQASKYGDNFILKQSVFYIIGFIIAFIVMQFDSERLKKACWYLYGFGIFLLLFLWVAPDSIAKPVNGAKCWFRFAGISLQPSEFMKIFLIITLAHVIQQHHTKYEVKTTKTDLMLLGKLAGLTLFPIAIIMQQPDLGTSIVFIAILIGMTFISGITYRLLLPIIMGGIGLIAVIFYFVLQAPAVLEKYLGAEVYQFNRIYSWLDPYNYPSDSGYQLVRSLMAIGSGEISGKGISGRQVFLPEAHSDFVFSIIGEEFGFIGASIVVILFFLLIYSWIKIALETKNEFNAYICVGVISMMTFHVFQNIGMTIGVLPITGIPLPFVSYGGSSLWGSMMALGLIFSIRYHHRVYMFSTRA